MADAPKYKLVNGGSLISELKTVFFFPRTKRTAAFAYGFMFAFVAVTMFLAFSPSSDSSSPWFTNIFSTSSSSSGATSSRIFSDESYRSHFSSIFSYFFPNSSQPAHNSPNNIPRSQNTPVQLPNPIREPSAAQNQTQSKDLNEKVEALKKSPVVSNQTVISVPKSAVVSNQTANSVPKSSVIANQPVNSVPKSQEVSNQTANQTANSVPKSLVTANQTVNSVPKSLEVSNQTANSVATPSPVTASEGAKIAEKGVVSNLSSSLLKKQSNETKNVGLSAKQGSENLVDSLMNCDLFDGEWVRDDSYPLYKPGSCSLIDEQFNCFLNGRPDNGYYKLRWKPKGCSIPRLNGTHMLELLRGKRLVFVGDSLNRNMWESLVCILRSSVKDQSKVYEASGRHNFRAEASYSFVFKDHDCTIEFFVSPFLVQEWEVSGKNGSKKETLRLDLVGRSSDQYKTADIIVFNTGHWWTHEKTSTGKDYYQEGSHVYSELNVLEAFRKALTTWGRWVDANINPKKTFVLFRGYSASHFSGGQWNSGGQCDDETEPIKNDTYLSEYPSKMIVLESVFKGMKKVQVSYMNITRMTDYRKDGHPSVYRKQNLSEEERKSPLRFQDCSHWCLPGVPDAWNEILYAELLIRQLRS